VLLRKKVVAVLPEIAQAGFMSERIESAGIPLPILPIGLAYTIPAKTDQRRGRGKSLTSNKPADLSEV
jgi:hypothetical protein